MSKDRYPSLFSHQVEAYVFTILQIFFTTCAGLKIRQSHSDIPSFSWGIFSHISRLNQSRASENIFWAIIKPKLSEFKVQKNGKESIFSRGPCCNLT